MHQPGRAGATRPSHLWMERMTEPQSAKVTKVDEASAHKAKVRI
jgi:hypothetical protein